MSPGSKFPWIGLIMALLLTLPVGRAAQATTIDIMLVYDTTAASWVSNQGGMTTFAQDVVNRMNQAAQNSGIDLSFRLVHTMPVAYTTTKDPCDDLGPLLSQTGVFAPVHAARNTYGADLVAMLMDHGSAYGYTGCGYVLNTWSGSPGYGFTVNAIRSAEISHVVTHEMGHNLGADHSKYQSEGPGPNNGLQNPAAPYSAGWYFTGTDGVSYHTIMAYNYDGKKFYEPAPLFSTPLKSYGGRAAGHAQDGDNARLITLTKDIVAGYRTAAASSYTLSVSKTGTGSGTVTSSPSGINCGTTCSANFSGSVTLTVAATGGSTFAGWSGDCSGTATSCTVTMSAAKNVTAKFDLTQASRPDLIVTAVTSPTTGVVGGKIDASFGIKNQGGQAAGSFRVGFYLSTDSTITTGDFPSWGCSYDSLAAGESSGCSGLIEIPSSLPAGLYYLGAYADTDGTITESSESNNGLAAPNRITITGGSAQTYTLTLNKTGTGTGTVSGSGSYASGATVNLTATSTGGSTFAGWSPSPCAASFTMPAANLTCTATFNPGGQRVGAAVGVFRNGSWFLDANGNGFWDGADRYYPGPFGQPGNSPVAGDWSNDGKAKVGVFKNGTWYLDYNGNGRWDGSGVDRYYAGSFGQAGDLPVAGDWSRDGKAKIGVFRAGAWYLDYNGNGFWDGGDSYYPGPFGKPGDLPVAGDWNNDGRAEVGVFKNGTWYLDYNGNGRWDGSDIDRYYPGTFGQFGDLPVAGDWNGDGKAEIGVFRAGSWYLDYNGDGAWNGCNVDRCYEGSFGNRGDLPVAGKW